MKRWIAPAAFLLVLLGSGCSPFHSGIHGNGTGGSGGGGGGGSTAGKLYVTTANSVLRFGSALTANGNVAPEATITGATTQLSSPRQILVDTTGNRLFVANLGGQSILIFSNASSATGNATPSAILTSAGNLVSPIDVAIDSTKNLLYVADGQNILVFSGQSTLSGSVNTPPTHTVTFTFSIGAILLDQTNDRLFITDPSHNAVDILPGASTATGPGASLISSITGSATGLNIPTGLALDASGKLIVSNDGSPASIAVFAASVVPGGGNVAPIATITGATTKLAMPGQMTVNTSAGSSGELYVADAATPGVLTFLNIGAATGTMNVAPTRDITGSSTGLNANAVNGIALDTTR